MLHEAEGRRTPASNYTTIVRLAPEAFKRKGTRLSGVSLADFTQEELLEGFETQDLEMPPFLVCGSYTLGSGGKAGTWRKAGAISHVSGNVVTTLPCKHVYEPSTSQAAVYAPLSPRVRCDGRAPYPRRCFQRTRRLSTRLCVARG